MNHSLDTFKKWFSSNEKTIEKQFFDFLRFPSISADLSFRPELKNCAKWVQNYLKEMGFDVQMWHEDDAPIIFASHMKAGSDKPTLLIYNHYDVQPVDPIELWDSKPFEPTREGDLIVARGAQDNKGQCMYVLAALQAIIKETGSLPINIKLCIEGQEESGSKLLSEIVSKKSKELQADYLLIADFGMRTAQTPAITLGMRGLTAWTIEVQGANTDMHSGFNGGIVYNPLHALVEILARLRDQSGQITIPGFYDMMVMPTADELSCLTFDFDEEEFAKEYGCKPTGGEKSFSPLQRAWLRPSLEINGISGGYAGPGTKTVIPSKAIAKLTSRLVPNQDPYDIAEKLKRYVEAIAPQGVHVTCTIHDGVGSPLRTSPHSPVVQALSKACEKVFQSRTEFILEGASIPVAAKLQEASKTEVALFGLGLASDKIHAPNECFNWSRLEKGFCIICDLLYSLAHKS